MLQPKAGRQCSCHYVFPHCCEDHPLQQCLMPSISRQHNMFAHLWAFSSLSLVLFPSFSWFAIFGDSSLASSSLTFCLQLFITFIALPPYRLCNCQLTYPLHFLQKENLYNPFHLISFSLISISLLYFQSWLMTLSSPDMKVTIKIHFVLSHSLMAYHTFWVHFINFSPFHPIQNTPSCASCTLRRSAILYLSYFWWLLHQNLPSNFTSLKFPL